MEQPRALTAAALLALCACGSPEQRMADRALHDGLRAHQDSAFLAADSAFSLAPGDARAVYDRGVNRTALRDHVMAAEYFDAAARMDSTPLRTMAWYNLGNARLDGARSADTAIRRIRHDIDRTAPSTNDINDRLHALVETDSLHRLAERLDAGIDSSLLGSVEAFKSTLRIDPADDDARHNLVLAKAAWAARQKEKERSAGDKEKDKDKALSERARLLIQKADELVDAFRFKDALDLLQDGLKKEPSLSSKKEYMDKLDLVTKASQGS